LHFIADSSRWFRTTFLLDSSEFFPESAYEQTN